MLKEIGHEPTVGPIVKSQKISYVAGLIQAMGIVSGDQMGNSD